MRREVEHDPALGDAVPGGAVAAAADGELEPVSRASVTTRATSAASAARTIMAGRRSTAPVKTARAWS